MSAFPELCLAYAAFRWTAKLSCSHGTFVVAQSWRGARPLSPGGFGIFTPMMASWPPGSGKYRGSFFEAIGILILSIP
jgi:hypothetical protein